MGIRCMPKLPIFNKLSNNKCLSQHNTAKRFVMSSRNNSAQGGGKRDMMTGQRRNKANNVSFSNKRTRKWQEVNLQDKRIYWPEGRRFVKLRIAARTIRTIDKNGVSAVAKKAGIDLWKLRFENCRPERLKRSITKIPQVPRPEIPKSKMKNPARLSASRKKPMVPRYIGGRVFWIREGEEKDIYRLIQSQMEPEQNAILNP